MIQHSINTDWCAPQLSGTAARFTTVTKTAMCRVVQQLPSEFMKKEINCPQYPINLFHQINKTRSHFFLPMFFVIVAGLVSVVKTNWIPSDKFAMDEHLP